MEAAVNQEKRLRGRSTMVGCAALAGVAFLVRIGAWGWLQPATPIGDMQGYFKQAIRLASSQAYEGTYIPPGYPRTRSSDAVSGLRPECGVRPQRPPRESCRDFQLPGCLDDPESIPGRGDGSGGGARPHGNPVRDYELSPCRSPWPSWLPPSPPLPCLRGRAASSAASSWA
jgi:hypothetical protein